MMNRRSATLSASEINVCLRFSSLKTCNETCLCIATHQLLELPKMCLFEIIILKATSEQKVSN